MGPHCRRIQQQAPRCSKGLGLQTLPQALPDPARFPPPEAHVDRVPIAQFRWQIPPRTPRAVEMENRFQELAITHLCRSSRQRMFGRFHCRSQFLPQLIADDFSHLGFAHPKFPPKISTLVQQIIREQNLVQCEKLKTRQVCKKCNNGWMSALEAWAQERFGQYVEPNTPFDHLAGLVPVREETDKVIQWLLKTAIMVERALPKGTMEKVVPALYPVAAGKEAPTDFHVWAAYIETANFNLHLTRGFPVWNGGTLQPYQIHAESMNFALQLNHLAFILFRCPNASPTVKAGVRLNANFRAAPMWLTMKATFPLPNRPYFPNFPLFVDSLEVTAQPPLQ
jgi:hypothetical protein